VKYPAGTPLPNLALTIMDMFGVRWTNVGDSTGKIEQLSVG
jgi:hypothetical protein